MNTSLEDTKFILKKYGIIANKKLGQNFLVDDNVIDTIVQASSVGLEDLVIEIGPGLGTLTAKLLEKAGRVIAIELDNKMIRILNDRFKLYNNFELINEDVLKVDLSEVINSTMNFNEKALDEVQVKEGKKERSSKERLSKVKIVANLPYYITTPIIMKLLEEKLKIDSITVMVQKEVAERIIAKPGDKLSGAITYSVNYYAEAEKVMFVNRNCFIPAPEVDSEVIKLNIRKEPAVKPKNEEMLFKVIKASFMQRRKTLANGLINSGLVQDREKIKEIFEKLGLDINVRGEKLTLQQFAALSDLIGK